tara:strand:- start:25 stop:588 length:564 start_codon:yes stop_codon:yes gene_type:complete
MNFIDVLNDSKFILIYVIMVKEFFQDEVVCDSSRSAACEARNSIITDWTTEYNRLRSNYLASLKDWLLTKIDNQPDTGSSKKQKVEGDYNLLITHLNTLNEYNNRIADNISASSAAISTNQDHIIQNNNTITHQDNDIKKLNISLVSKKRQIEFTMERNRNRRIMIAILIIINLILIGVTYFLYTKK